MNPNQIVYEDENILIRVNTVRETVYLNKATDTEVRIISNKNFTGISLIDGKGRTALAASITSIEEEEDKDREASDI